MNQGRRQPAEMRRTGDQGPSREKAGDERGCEVNPERNDENGPESLCFPDDKKSCFACCPPIRPEGYEHILYKQTIQRFLREDTALFSRIKEQVRPITGFSCWALGYLDGGRRLVGCLLHPAQNKGRDLRYRVDYGEKCRRESCQEAKEFLSLSPHPRKFFLSLATGLDSFSYSSRRHNPLFTLLGWGSGLLNRLAYEAWEKTLERTTYLGEYPFFRTLLNPKANAYLLDRSTSGGRIRLLQSEDFRTRFEQFSAGLAKRLGRMPTEAAGGVHTHLLDLDPSFLDYLRLSGGIRKLERNRAQELKEVVDEEVTRFERETVSL